MSNSMFSPNKLVAPQTAYDVTQEDIEQERARQAKEQFDEEVTLYSNTVWGPKTDRVQRPSTQALSDGDYDARLSALERYACAQDKYLTYVESCLERMFKHNVTIMRGIALQAQAVNGNAVDAAGMAQKAWDSSQQMIEVHGARQVALNTHLWDLRRVMRAVLAEFASGTSSDIEQAKDNLDESDPDSAAAVSREAVTKDFEDAYTRLVAVAKAKAGESGRIITGGEGASRMAASYVRQHGEELSARATAPKNNFTSRIVKARR